MKHLSILTILIILFSSLIPEVFAQEEMETVILEGEVNNENYEHKKIIITGETFSVKTKLDLDECIVIIQSSHLTGTGDININNEEGYNPVILTADLLNIDMKKFEVKNSFTTIKASSVITAAGSHVRFENGSLTNNNSVWELDGHVDFQAHNDEVTGYLQVNMENVIIHEISDQIHYKKDVDWEFVGGCISLPESGEFVEDQSTDERPEFIPCDELTDQVNYFEGNLDRQGTTTLTWGMFSESEITSYEIYTSEDQNTWSPLTEQQASGSEGPISYVYTDNDDRFDRVYFRLDGINGPESDHLDTVSIYYGDDDLPVELIYFDAEVLDQSVLLKWATASEQNSDYFEVQYSYDEEDWHLLDQVKAAGNSSTRIEYQYEDKLRNGIVYYRLKQVDFDGQFEYFGPVEVTLESPEEFDVVAYPVPQYSGQEITITPNNNEPYQLLIFNQMGQNVFFKEDLQNETRLATTWGRGMFVVHIIQGSQKEILKLQIH
ncbi:T9SS type A sorting domain-containing protein [Flammeovirga sp. MY04]|nr:T9SS type A sorting domain-containing protein [Flammeovirga sp. MY04]ANQ51877.1 T9SS type A sorting domain-containing protein [Flammeovirga sp. MY04]